MDPLYLSVLVSAEKKFWRCVQSGETPHLINAESPRPRIEASRYEFVELLGVNRRPKLTPDRRANLTLLRMSFRPFEPEAAQLQPQVSVVFLGQD